jgi:hypothetical protein
LLIGGAIDPGMDDFLLHAGAEAGAIQAQRLALREKN